MSNLQESIRNLGTKVNGVEPEGILVKDILKSFGETFTGKEITSNKVFEVIDEIADNYTPPEPPVTKRMSPFVTGDVVKDGDYIYFNPEIPDSEIIKYAEMLSIGGGYVDIIGSQIVYMDKYYNADTEEEKYEIKVAGIKGADSNIVWAEDTYRTGKAGWQNLDEEGRIIIWELIIPKTITVNANTPMVNGYLVGKEYTPPAPVSLNPIEVNDVFVNGNKIYFDTSVNVEEMFDSVDTEALLIQGKIYNGDTEISNSQMMMVANDGNDGYIIGFCNDGDTPLFIYSTNAVPELELDAGWQGLDADDSLTINFYSQTITSLKITHLSDLEGWNGIIVGTK